MTTLQDILGLITKRKIKTPSDNDYIISAAYSDTQEVLKPQPKMEASLLNIGALKKYVLASIAPPTYKVYTALLTQTGTNAPVATVLENSVPIDITYGYVAAGVFNVSFPYPSNIVSTKLAIILGKIMNEQSAGTYTYDSLGYSGGNITFNLKTKTNASTFSNYVLNNTFIEIRIYN